MSLILAAVMALRTEQSNAEAELVVIFGMYLSDAPGEAVRAEIEAWAADNEMTTEQAVDVLLSYSVVPIGGPAPPVAPPGFWQWFDRNVVQWIIPIGPV